MNTSLLTIFIISFYLCLASTSFADTGKKESNKSDSGKLDDKKSLTDSSVAVVDINLVFKTLILKNKDAKELKKLKTDLMYEIKKRENEIKSLNYQYNYKKNYLNDEDKKKLLLEIELKQSRLAQWLDEQNLALKKKENEIKGPLVKKIFEVLNKLRKEKNIKVIINKKEVLLMDEQVDLTQELIDRFIEEERKELEEKLRKIENDPLEKKT